MCDFSARSEIRDYTKLIQQVVGNYWENIVLKIREMTANTNVTYNVLISLKRFFYCVCVEII